MNIDLLKRALARGWSFHGRWADPNGIIYALDSAAEARMAWEEGGFSPQDMIAEVRGGMMPKLYIQGVDPEVTYTESALWEHGAKDLAAICIHLATQLAEIRNEANT